MKIKTEYIESTFITEEYTLSLNEEEVKRAIEYYVSSQGYNPYGDVKLSHTIQYPNSKNPEVSFSDASVKVTNSIPNITTSTEE